MYKLSKMLQVFLTDRECTLNLKVKILAKLPF